MSEEDKKQMVFTGCNTPTNVVCFESITREMRVLYAKKNQDYGNSFGKRFERFGIVSAIIRMDDKLSRLESLCTKEALVNDESIRDTLIDLANYAVMTIMELDKQK